VELVEPEALVDVGRAIDAKQLVAEDVTDHNRGPAVELGVGAAELRHEQVPDEAGPVTSNVVTSSSSGR